VHLQESTVNCAGIASAVECQPTVIPQSEVTLLA